MAIHFSTKMKIESKNCHIPIIIYSKIEKKKFNTNVFFVLFFLFKLLENKMWNSKVGSHLEIRRDKKR